MFKTNSFILYVIITLVLMTMCSCVTNRNIKDGEIALVKNRLKLVTDIKGKRKTDLRLSLESLYKQQPTKLKVFNPRTWGGKYTPFDEELTEGTREDFQNLLVNRKGFYSANVTYNTELNSDGGMLVTYLVETGPQYFIDSLRYSSDDVDLLNILNNQPSAQAISKGVPLDAETFDQEKDRIVAVLQNNGYANFTKNFVEFRGDSTASGNVIINVHIYPPGQDETHKRYHIGNINVYTDHLNGEYDQIGTVDTLDGISFIARGDEFKVRPSGLSKAIGLRTGALYQKRMESKTYSKLTALSPYRFAIINPSVSEQQDSTINFDIFLTPRQNKWGFDAGTNLFYSTFSAGSRNNLLGFNSAVNFENRNFLQRAYRYLIDLEGTFEFDFTNFPRIDPNTITFQLDNTVEIPRNVELFNFGKFLNKLNIVKDKAYSKFKNETTTELNVNYRFSDIFDLYRLNSFNASWSYNYQPSTRTRIRYNQLGFNYVNVTIDSLFRDRFLSINPLLEQSFTDQLFTGLLFRDISFYHLSKESNNRSQFAFISNFEVSGLENYLINSLVNVFEGDSKYWTLSNVNFAKFLRLENELRFYKKFRGKRVLAMRFNVGVAAPYGADETIEGDGTVPFIKQFFVGGPNSLRAWRLRELGAGGDTEYILGPQDVPPFASGDFKLDFSAEYRFKLFWLMDGAVFLDAGNVWALKGEDGDVRKLSSNFLNQVAIGTGWGLRFDLTYFILRFDMGYKLRNPFPDPETGSYSAFNSTYNSFPFGNINFAINYPF
jgi:hypothetical protein